METIAEEIGDTSEANPSSVKSDGSPCAENGRSSPPPNCAICLETCRNKSFTDSCLHQFCFDCLVTWSKVKAECPLCKQNFRTIIHNVRSNQQYEEYMVEQRQEESVERIDIDNININISNALRRFRYRTTLTVPRRESTAILPYISEVLSLSLPRLTVRGPPSNSDHVGVSFRRTVYMHNLWARPLPDLTGRFRDCSPEFYRNNSAQMHRLIPWLKRELRFLLEDGQNVNYVIDVILGLLPLFHITSDDFWNAMRRYIGARTEHFLHEFYCFASTPFDLLGYDRNVHYTTDSRVSTMVNEVSSESDESESDIVMLPSSEPAQPQAGPSRVPEPVYPTAVTDNVVPIEIVSHSDTDDDNDDVMVVGYLKPPQDRTPEVVDLLGSDSDVIVQDSSQVEPPAVGGTPPLPETNLVKLSLKRHRPDPDNMSDSDDNWFINRSNRMTLNDNLNNLNTSHSREPLPPLVKRSWSPVSSYSTSSVSYSSSVSCSFSSSTYSSNDSTWSYGSESSDSSVRQPPKKKKKYTKKSHKSKGSRRKSSKSKSSSHAEKSKKRKEKSRSGKTAKSSKKKKIESKDRPVEEVVNEMPGSSEKRSKTKGKSGSGKGIKSSKKQKEPNEGTESTPIAETINNVLKHTDKNNRRKEKSHSGKGVKSSKKTREPDMNPIPEQICNNMFGHTERSSRSRERSIPNRDVNTIETYKEEEEGNADLPSVSVIINKVKHRDASRESKRLKSVVKIINSPKLHSDSNNVETLVSNTNMDLNCDSQVPYDSDSEPIARFLTKTNGLPLAPYAEPSSSHYSYSDSD